MTARVIIDGQDMDFETVASLPFSLTASVDNFLELIGTGSVEVDNSAKQLFLPASKRNLAVYDNPHIPSSDTLNAQRDKPVQVYFNDQLTFDGIAVFRGCVYEQGQVIGMKLELFGGNEIFFSLLTGVYLDDLDLGTVLYDEATIAASANQNWPNVNASFAEVVYGDGRPKQTFSTATYTGGTSWTTLHTFTAAQPMDYNLALEVQDAGSVTFRVQGPSSTFTVIPGGSVTFTLEAGETLEMQGFNSGSDAASNVVWKLQGSQYVQNWEYYRPHIYFAHILKTAVEYTGYTINSGLLNTEHFRRFVYLYGVGDKWKTGGDNFVFEQTSNSTFTASSTNWQIITGMTIVPTQTGVYKLTLSHGARTNHDIRIRNVATGEVYTQTDPFRSLVADGILVSAGDSLVAEARLTSAGAVGAIGPVIRLLAETSSLPVLGATIDLASCLHHKTVLDFLRGVTYMFNLAWYADPLSKSVTVEPRFHYGNGANQELGFYRPELGHFEDYRDIQHIPAEESIIERPFGDFLTMGNMPEDSLLGDRAAQQGIATTPSLFRARIPMVSTGEEGTVQLNPYFEDLLLIDDEFAYWDLMPIVVPDYKDTGFPEEFTYESNPKYAVIDGFKALAPWIREDMSVTTEVRTIAWQKPPTRLPFEYTPQYQGSFSEYNNLGKVLPGLVDDYWQTYLYIMRKGLFFKTRLDLPPDKFYYQQWRLLKTLDVQGPHGWILTLIENYQPANQDFCDATFVLYQGNTETFSSTFIHNLQRSEVSLI